MADIRTLFDVVVENQRVLTRVDLNVPIDGAGYVTDRTRIRAIKPTIAELVGKRAKIILLAHFGRPKGVRRPEMSLKQVVPALAETIGKPVVFVDDCIGDNVAAAVANMTSGEVMLLENTRFHPGEEANNREFAAALAENGDIYVNDAFSACHRAHASTEGIAHFLPSVAGRAMQREIDALSKALHRPKRPVAAVVGGAKVSTKIDLLENLVRKVDTLIIGGGMANTFLAAKGTEVGKSLCEHDLADTARKIMSAADDNDCEIVLPVDVVVAAEFKADAASNVVSVDSVPSDAMILDAGPTTSAIIADRIDGSKTLLWNGPLGAFEIIPFDKATVDAARHAAGRTISGQLMSIAGGGDTVAALNHASATKDFSYVSTAGGAFLEWLEGKSLPGVEVLRRDN